MSKNNKWTEDMSAEDFLASIEDSKHRNAERFGLFIPDELHTLVKEDSIPAEYPEPGINDLDSVKPYVDRKRKAEAKAHYEWAMRELGYLKPNHKSMKPQVEGEQTISEWKDAERQP